jgi:hypothetical protein
MLGSSAILRLIAQIPLPLTYLLCLVQVPSSLKYLQDTIEIKLSLLIGIMYIQYKFINI